MSNPSINAVIVSTLFPNAADPARGVFTFQIVQALKEYCNVCVISPLPWFPKGRFFNKFKRWNIFASVPYHDKLNGIDVYYPRYPVIPKILTWLHPVFMLPSLYTVVKRLHMQGKADIINTHWIYPDGVASTWISRYLDIPQVLVGLGCDITHYPYLPNRKNQICSALRNADSVMAVSNDLGNRINKLTNCRNEVKLSPDGVDFKRFNIKNQQESRAKLGIDKQKKIILQVASLDEVKGTKYLIKAAAELQKKIGDMFHVYIIGDGVLKNALKKQAEDLSISDLIHFAGRKPHDEIPLWMNAADVFCLSSIREGRPNVLLESIACGIPVVATAVGGVPEIITFENGFLSESKNPYDISEKLEKALTYNWDRKNISKCVSHLTWKNAAKVYFQEFNQILNRKSSS